jgi:RNA methyltransferase, TrmH family
VLFTEGSVDVSNPKSVRSSAGAVFHVPVATDVSLAALRTDLGLPLLGTAAVGGTAYDRADLRAPVAVVLGNEAHGMPADLPLDGLLTIPHAGRAESLNVAMAASVLCFEVARQRRT